jgi:uncharacterized protein Veg
MQTTADKAKEIRSLIKKQFGFNGKQVSVKKSSGGYESAIHVTAKTLDAAMVIDQIAAAVEPFKEIYRDERSGEILGGGNTFIFCGIDVKLELSLIKQKAAELDGLIAELKNNPGVSKQYKNNTVFYLSDRYPCNFTVKNDDNYTVYDEYNFKKTLAFL